MNACCVTDNFSVGKGPGLRVMGKHACGGHDSVTCFKTTRRSNKSGLRGGMALGQKLIYRET